MADQNGLLSMRARYYNPYLCRFISQDPAGFGGGLNFYTAFNGNPVIYLDPFGLNAYATGDNFWTWLGQEAFNGSVNTVLNATGASSLMPSSLSTGWSLFNKYGLSGYAQGNGIGNTSVMMLGEFAGTTPFAEGWYGTDIGYGTSLTTGQSAQRLVSGGVSMAGWVAAGYGAAGGLSTPSTAALSPYRVTTAGETFYHYGYFENAANFEGGLNPGSYATSIGTLSGAEAQSGLALPRPTAPPNAVYTIKPTPGTPIAANPLTAPNFGQIGGLPEYRFPVGTMPGTVSGPVLIP